MRTSEARLEHPRSPAASAGALGSAALGALLVTTLVLIGLAPVHGQAEVSAIIRNAEALETTDDVVLSRFADFSEAPGIEIGTQLEPGDMLSSISGETDVELLCGEATVLRFAGGFRVLIDAPVEADCATNFLGGTLDVVTDQPTAVDTGAVVLGSEGTQYTVELTRDESGPDRRLVVFDGKVRLRFGETEAQVDTGKTWNLRGREGIWGSVSAADLDKTSQRYAAFDASRQSPGLEPAEKEALVARFKTLHYGVLSEPDKTEKRADLAREQLKYQQTPQAIYNLKRGDITTPEKRERYQIDEGVAQMMSLSNTAMMSRRIAAGPVVAQPILRMATPDPFALIDEERYAEALEILKRSAESAPNSRVYFGLARAYLGLDGLRSAEAHAFAGRALEEHRSDGLLSQVDASYCQRIRRAYRP